jgi:transposase InsO family protein
MVAPRESATLAQRLIADTLTKQHIARQQLTIHADRGSSMASKTVAQLLADLGVTKSHSRPHVSDDNPFSEAQFKTLKYRPDFPRRFGSIEHAREHCRTFYTWYNGVHRHSGIGYHTPTMSTMDTRHTYEPPGPTCLQTPTPATPNGSSATTPNHQNSRQRRGSTGRHRWTQ